MVRRADSSIESPGSDEGEREERPILIKRTRPNLLGINLTFLLNVGFLFHVGIAALHCAFVVGTSARVNGGEIMSLMYGFLGPIAVIFWAVVLMYVFHGTRALYTTPKDYWLAASYFRRWARISRYLIVAQTAALAHFFLGCYMLVYSTSLSFHAVSFMRKNKLKGFRRAGVKRYAELHDTLILADVTAHHPFPLNFFMWCGRSWGYMAGFGMLVPLLSFYMSLMAQEKYYNWRFAHTGIKID